MAGGLFLCYEGVEKVAHSLFHRKESAHLDISLQPSAAAVPAPPTANRTPDELSAAPTPEQRKIKGAIRTDFILSAEIIAITLGTVAVASFTTQAIVVSSVAVIMTIAVYGLVAGIVKLDDGGLYLSQRRGRGFFASLSRRLGSTVLTMAPYLMKSLSIAGTIAMFLVGGSILMHGIPGAEELIHGYVDIGAVASPSLWRRTLSLVGPTLANAIVGIVAGFITLLVVNGVKRVKR
jgi:predicted DNA repair protein MutK